ncbi:diacylglycerol kinase family lipid kinase [Streptococcus sp. DD13]|uniref:diacylglycerol kinase family lipid kinase n=1 Tax=Streptococcus sp. DD13 TaxID=1777881 RepID=UPI0007920AB1|nr:diacylglycerol kinase family lipid kinase [Streptococcus sp. DD13]KXT79189.1 Transcription regulator [Streptococcus sp. DD13]
MAERKRARLIYNPTSGKEIMKKNVAEILDILEGFGYEASAFKTRPEENSALNEARRAGEAGFDLVIAAGGDGTIHEVVNGIAPLAKRPQMAIIPAGTTNDFARALKVPRNNPLAAARLIGKQQTIQMDIGEVRRNNQTEKYFINIAAMGTLTELTYRVSSKLKTMLGYLAYVVKGAELLPRVQFTPVRVRHEDGVFEGRVSLIFIALTNSVSGFEQIVPDAKLDDGKFTLILVKTASLFEILDLVRLMMNGGKHIHSDKILYIKSKNVEIEKLEEVGPPLMLNLDGEYGKDAPVQLINLAKHIEFFADTDRVSTQALTINEDKEQCQAIQNFVDQSVSMTEEDSLR